MYEMLFEMNNQQHANDAKMFEHAIQYSLDGAAGTVTRLRTGQSGFDPRPAGTKQAFLLRNAQTGSGDHPASYEMDSGENFPHIKPSRGVGEREKRLVCHVICT